MSLLDENPSSPVPSTHQWLLSMPRFQETHRRRILPFLSSLGIHTVILVILGTWILPVLTEGVTVAIIDASFTPESADTHTNLDQTAVEITTNFAAAVPNASMAAAAVDTPPPTPITASSVRIRQRPRVLPPAMHTLNHLSDDVLMSEVPILMSALPIHEHRGETRVAEAQGTDEIASALHGDLRSIASDGDAIVVWMLDQSLSMQLDIKALAQQLLGTLESVERDKSSKMMHYVVAFGDDVTLIQDSTIKAQAVARSIYGLPADPSGIENTFQSVEWCVDNLFNSHRWLRGKERQKLLVLWTDESGDDYLRLEHTIRKCLQANVRVDVIGPSAVLGAQKGHMSFLHPADNRVYQLPVHRGPDSSFPQKLSLGYWYRGVPTNYNESFRGPWPGSSARYGGSNFESLLSGFSPYALTRLSRETGGRYTIYDRPADRSPFPLEQVRDYLPDYRSVAEIEFMLRRQPLRQIVLASAAETWRSNLTRYSQPPLVFRPDFSGEQPVQYRRTTLPNRLRPAISRAYATAKDVEKALAVFAAAVSRPAFQPQTEYAARTDNARPERQRNDSSARDENQEPAGDNPSEDSDQQNRTGSSPNGEPDTNSDMSVLETDVNETLLEQLYRMEDSKRWRAWCDLNIGRLLAVSVRLREYLITTNALLNNMNGLNDDTNHVWLTATDQLRGGAPSKDRAVIARRVLQRCVDDNPGTPWSLMAARELKDGFGVQLNQRFVPRPPPSPPTVGRPQPPRPTLPNL